MEKFKGNKGKWSIGSNHTGVIVTTEKPERIGYTDSDFEWEEKQCGGYILAESIPTKQDAQLITAAPDMLKALQTIVEFWNTPQLGSLHAHVLHSLELAKEAIDKALKQ